MRSLLLTTLCALALSGCGDEESTTGTRLLVDGEADVYTFSPKPYDGDGGHCDGIATLDFTGSAFEVVDGKRRPLAGVTFTALPNSSFADCFNQKQNIISDESGDFSGTLAVGAAITVGGAHQGRPYQTRRSQVRVEKEGFHPQLLWFDYEMPEVDVVLKRAEQGYTWRWHHLNTLWIAALLAVSFTIVARRLRAAKVSAEQGVPPNGP